MKKRIILILLTFLLLFLVGCNQKVASNEILTKSEEIAYNWLNTPDYECPKDYSVKVQSQKNNQIVVVKDDIIITYNISENSVELDSVVADYSDAMLTTILVSLIVLLGILTAASILN